MKKINIIFILDIILILQYLIARRLNFSQSFIKKTLFYFKQVYRVGVVFNKAGWYPIGVCAQNMTCDSVFFSFGVGNSTHAVRDALIRSIVFTYH